MGQQLKLWDSKRERKLSSLNTMRPVRRTKEELRDPTEELASADRPIPRRRQEAGKRGKLGLRDGTPTKPQTGSQFLTKDFRRFWMVDIRQEGRG